MKKSVVAILLSFVLVFISLFFISKGDWHLKRNKFNILPEGVLSLKSEVMYQDENGLLWELQPNSKNIFHQPEHLPVSLKPGAIPYPNVKPQLEYDSLHPNLKFLSLDGKRGSFEGILKPDGLYLISGKKQGTYNYCNPSGFWGMSTHVILDVIPHFFNSNYDDSLNK